MCTGPQKRMVSVKRAISNKNIRTLNIKLQKENSCCCIAIKHDVVVFKTYLLKKVYYITMPSNRVKFQ